MTEFSNLRFVVLFLTFFGLFLDIFVFDYISGLAILFLAGLWIFVIKSYGYGSGVSLGMGLIFLILCPFLLIFNAEAVAEKAAIWAYLFLVVGIGQQVIEYFRERK